MKVLLIEDEPFSRDGTRLALQELDSTIEMLEAANLGQSFACLLVHRDVQLILLDLYLVENQGIATLLKLKTWLEEYDIQIRVVVLSGQSDVTLVNEVLEHSGSGVILKGTSREVLMRALSLTLAGGVPVPEGFFDPIHSTATGRIGAGRDEGSALAARLTRREREVASLLIEGYTYKRIGEELAREGGNPISAHTVRVHVGSIAWKFGVTGNVKAGVMAVIARHRLVFVRKPFG